MVDTGRIRADVQRARCIQGARADYIIQQNFTSKKISLNFLEKLYDFKIVDNDDVAMHMSGVVHKIYGDDFSKLTNWDIEVIYEMILTYFFSFEHGVPHRENAKRFFDMIRR